MHRIRYKSIIKAGSRKDSVTYHVNGNCRQKDDEYVISFVADGERFEIRHNDHHVFLSHDDARLYMTRYEDMENDYKTAYGPLRLTTRVKRLKSDPDKLALVYDLLVSDTAVSTVYLMVTCQQEN